MYPCREINDSNNILQNNCPNIARKTSVRVMRDVYEYRYSYCTST